MQYLLFSPSQHRLFPSLTSLLRGLASSSQPPKIWLDTNNVTPPVQIEAFEGMAPPSALSWLRRRGPQIHHGHLFKLFRERAIRLFESSTGKVKRVGRSRVLADGDRLLWPKALGMEDQSLSFRSEIEPRSEAETEALKKQLILNSTAHFIFVNKPAGLEVQGGQGQPSLKGLIDSGVFNGVLSSNDLKLVHRLDKLVSGVIVLARGQDAAAYISRAFRDKSEQAVRFLSGDPAPSPSSSSLTVDKTYTALVYDRDGQLRQGDKGKVNLPVPSSAWNKSQDESSQRPEGHREIFDPHMEDPGLPSLTLYDVKETFLTPQGTRVALVELSPETGRRHQLRLHCSFGLRAPIIGDVAYGHNPLAIQKIRASLPTLSASWKGRDLPIMLHSQSVVLKTRGEIEISSTAPLPPHMKTLLDALREMRG